jgi:hypothetical protein
MQLLTKDRIPFDLKRSNRQNLERVSGSVSKRRIRQIVRHKEKVFSQARIVTFNNPKPLPVLLIGVTNRPEKFSARTREITVPSAIKATVTEQPVRRVMQNVDLPILDNLNLFRVKIITQKLRKLVRVACHQEFIAQTLEKRLRRYLRRDHDNAARIYRRRPQVHGKADSAGRPGQIQIIAIHGKSFIHLDSA